MSRRIAAVASALVVLLSTTVAQAADPPTIFVFHAPADAAEPAQAARDELARIARARGAPLIDVSPAPAAPPRAALHLRRAYEAYHDFKYPDALAALEDALAEAAITGADGLSPSELSDLFLYRGLVASEQGNGARVWEEFVRAAGVDPTRKLDPVRFPPRVVEEFGRASAAVAATTAPLTVDAPAGCKVSIDARPAEIGRSIDVTAGEHFLRVSCPDKLPHGERVTVGETGSRVTPALRDPDRPTLASAIKLAERRGAARVVWAVASGPAEPSPSLLLVAADVARGAELSRRVIAIDAGGLGTISTAVDAMLPSLGAASPEVSLGGRRGREHWYENRWLWGGVGAAVAAAVLLPFVFDGGEGGFEVKPGGKFR